MPITKKDAEIQADTIVKSVITEKISISELLSAIISKDETIRYPYAIAVEKISQEHPSLLYPEWNYFTNLLKSKNAFHRSIAITTIANLINIDNQNKFDELYDDYFKHLDDASVMVSRYLAIRCGMIAKAKPKLKYKITEILLQIDESRHSQSRKDLIKGDIIESFGEYCKDLEDKERIIEFVKKQLKSSSPSTVKKAKKFLSVHSLI
jgi:hypothetical protein